MLCLQVVTVDGNDHKIEFDGLLPGSSYTVQVIGTAQQYNSPIGEASSVTGNRLNYL